MFTYSQLTSEISFEAAIEEIRGMLEDQGIDTSTWAPADPQFNVLQMMAFHYWQHTNRIRDAVLLLNNQTSSGSALTLLSDNWFDNQRFSSVSTIGKFIITGSAAAELPKTFNPSEFTVTDGNLIFKNQFEFTISNAVPYVTESFIAAAPGAQYNIAPNAALIPARTQIGFFVSNPPSPSSPTWIDTFGQDAEKDPSLIIRNKTKWSTLQIGIGTEDQLRYLALSASQTNTNVGIDDSQTDGTGVIKVFLSEDTQTATSASVAAAQLIFNQVYPFNTEGEYVRALPATEKVFDRTITIYYSPVITAVSQISAEVFSTINAWIADVKIGGNDYLPLASGIASITRLIKLLEQLTYIEKVQLSDTSDIALARFEKLVAPSNLASVVSFVRLSNLSL